MHCAQGFRQFWQTALFKLDALEFVLCNSSQHPESGTHSLRPPPAPQMSLAAFQGFKHFRSSQSGQAPRHVHIHRGRWQLCQVGCQQRLHTVGHRIQGMEDVEEGHLLSLMNIQYETHTHTNDSSTNVPGFSEGETVENMLEQAYQVSICGWFDGLTWPSQRQYK